MKNSTYSRRSAAVSKVKKVTRQDSRGLLAEERSPGGGSPPRCRIQAVAVQRGADRGCRDSHAEVLVTPVQAPNANAYAERWVRTVRAECLDWLLIIGRGHLEQVLRVYAAHYNAHRPHRALGLEPPDPPADLIVVPDGQPSRVHRRDLLGGLLHEYHRRAA